jgi:tRNA-dihydrouridine synthase
MKNFWQKLPQPFFCLAPMEDVTNVAFRQVVAKAAQPDVFFTEFVNVSGFAHPEGKASVARRLQTAPTDTPIVAQIWGSRPADFSLTAAEISQMGTFAGIDINMGCPDKSVVKSGSGAALITNPNLAVEIIQAVKDGTRSVIASAAKQSSNNSTGSRHFDRDDALPISAKTRLGYSSISEWQDWLTVLLEQDLAALTIHLRTRKEMSKVPAHHELIPDIVKLRDTISPNTQLVINGDIKSILQGRTLKNENCGINGFMIGRGVFVNPFCLEKNPRSHSQAELLDLLKLHLSLFDETTQRYEPLKKFFKIYINDFPGAKELRVKLMDTSSPDQALEILRNL